MHLTKTFSVLRQLNVGSVIRSRVNLQGISIKRWSSASSGPVEEKKFQETAVGEEKKTMNGPFVKNLFVGVFDSEVLEYPEYPSMEHIRELDKLTIPIEDYVLNVVDSQKIDETQKISDDTTNTLKEHNLYALQAPKHLGGYEVDDKCFARYFESIGTEFNVSTSLSAHYRALNALLAFGNTEQKERLIPRMTSGELKVAVCLAEKPSILEIADMETVALPDKDDGWNLTGKKIWVPEGDKADFFLVFAKTWKGSISASRNTELSLFLVPKNAMGVKCGSNLDQLGTRGVGLCDVTFYNVFVPKENVVGKMGDGAYMAMHCLSKGRLAAAASSVSYLKNLLNTVAEYTVNTKIGDKSLYTMEYYQKQLGVMAGDIYALESMVYLTAGLKDTYQDADLVAEESVVNIFRMEKVVEIVEKCANLIGGSAYIKGSPIEQSIRDARSYLIHDAVPINVTKIHVASISLQHAGVQIHKEIKKARNPLNFPSFALKNFFNDRKALDGEVKIPELLRLTLHPSLSGDADKLESCVVRLECIVKNLFRRWGVEVIDRHMDMIKLTDCVIAMYAMAAVLGRASRSYCIGLANSNYDMSVANAFCGIQSERVNEIFENIYGGPMESYDAPYVAIGEQIAKHKGYFFQHPLARNY